MFYCDSRWGGGRGEGEGEEKGGGGWEGVGMYSDLSSIQTTPAQDIQPNDRCCFILGKVRKGKGNERWNQRAKANQETYTRRPKPSVMRWPLAPNLPRCR